MKKVLIFSMIAVFALVFSGLCLAVELALEAEFATHIEPPQVIAVPADAAALGPEPDAPSRGAFVWAPGAPLEGGDNGNAGFIRFEINMPEAGTYAVWARIIAWDGNSDSFYTTWEPADPAVNPQDPADNNFRWSLGNGETWHWDRIEVWADDGSHTDKEWVIPAGPTTLTIWTREDAAMLDSIFITDNLSSEEAEANPRVPSDDDLAAVTPSGKLAVTWGSIRSAR